MKVLALPKDPNPYQELLYQEMRSLGVKVEYIGELTPIRTLNLLLLPLEVAVWRLAGARLIHLHWVIAFAVLGGRSGLRRRVSYIWFLVWLWTCQALGMHVVWTVHNVLPHEPVFPDDVAARRKLAASSALVITHSEHAVEELRRLGAQISRSVVIPHGPFTSPASAESLRKACDGGVPRQFLFFGHVREYKGVEDLLVAFAALSDDVPAWLTIVGQCDDERLRLRLHRLTERCGERVHMRLERVSTEELTRLLDATDVVVLPFRQVTTSGSAMLAMGHGRPVVVPNVAAFADVPDQAVLRYRGVEGLTAALVQLAQANSTELRDMSDAARMYASRVTWREIAETTKLAMDGLIK